VIALAWVALAFAVALFARGVRYRLAKRRYETRAFTSFDPQWLRRVHRGWTDNYRGWQAEQPRTRINRRMAARCRRQVRAVERAARRRRIKL
jgi:hypothetical protein